MEYTVLMGPKSVSSSWLSSIALLYAGNKTGVGVEFIDGTQVFYPDTTVEDYNYLSGATSKGKAIWRKFYDLPYEVIN